VKEEAEMWFIGKLSYDKRGVGSIIGAVFILLILLSGFTFYILSVNVTEEYTRTLQDIQQLDLLRKKEGLEFRSVSVTGNDNLNITVKNTGSYDVHLIWLGIFDETTSPITQEYSTLDVYINPAETKTNIGSSVTIPVGQRTIQLVTELGNIFPTTLTNYTPASIGYRSDAGVNGLNSPKTRIWDGSSWSSGEERGTSGDPIRFVRLAYDPCQSGHNEKIMATLTEGGDLDAYVWNGVAWTRYDIATITATQAYRPFDVEYEKTAGKALLVYFTNTADEIGYKIWNGTSWSAESSYDLVPATSAGIYWISLTQNPTTGSNELAFVCIDATSSPPHEHAYALIWNGSSWGDKYTLTSATTIETTEDVAVAYEQISGYAHFAYATGTDVHVVRRTGVGVYTDYTVDLSVNGGPRYLSLKADPASNRLMLLCLDALTDLNTADWNPSTWTTHTEHDAAVDFDTQRCADVEWEPTGSKTLLVWGTSSGALQYKTWSSASGWSDASSITAQNTHRWVQLKRNPQDVSGGVKILGAMINNDGYLGALKWDGSTLTNIGDATFTMGTQATDYECFEIAFRSFNDP
jgi:hypothetical protein